MKNDIQDVLLNEMLVKSPNAATISDEGYFKTDVKDLPEKFHFYHFGNAWGDVMWVVCQSTTIEEI